jgi:hypothetical protein
MVNYNATFVKRTENYEHYVDYETGISIGNISSDKRWPEFKAKLDAGELTIVEWEDSDRYIDVTRNDCIGKIYEKAELEDTQESRDKANSLIVDLNRIIDLSTLQAYDIETEWSK